MCGCYPAYTNTAIITINDDGLRLNHLLKKKVKNRVKSKEKRIEERRGDTGGRGDM